MTTISFNKEEDKEEDNQEISYYSRLSSGEKLKRTISRNTLYLFETWFEILPKNSSNKVLVSLLIHRLKDMGIKDDEIYEKYWNSNDYINIDIFFDLLISSGLYEKYLKHKRFCEYDKYNYVPIPKNNKNVLYEDGNRVERDINNNESNNNLIKVKRRDSVLDLFKQVLGGGIKRVGDVKIHPKEVIKRKETPPHFHEGFHHLKRITKIKIFGVV